MERGHRRCSPSLSSQAGCRQAPISRTVVGVASSKWGAGVLAGGSSNGEREQGWRSRATCLVCPGLQLLRHILAGICRMRLIHLLHLLRHAGSPQLVASLAVLGCSAGPGRRRGGSTGSGAAGQQEHGAQQAAAVRLARRLGSWEAAGRERGLTGPSREQGDQLVVRFGAHRRHSAGQQAAQGGAGLGAPALCSHAPHRHREGGVRSWLAVAATTGATARG